MARLSFRCDDDLVAAVDRARGDVARERWLRRAVEFRLLDEKIAAGRGSAEQALSEAQEPSKRKQADLGSVPSLEGVRSAASAEQPHKRREKPSGCHEHPTAGRVESRGQWWCAEPGCTRSLV